MKWGVLGLAVGLLVASSAAWATPPTLDYTTTVKTAVGNGREVDTTFWDPAEDHRFVLQGCIVNANNASITVEFEVSDVDVLPPMRFESTGQKVMGFGSAPLYVSATDAVLTYTVTGSGAWSIMCAGYEEIL